MNYLEGFRQNSPAVAALRTYNNISSQFTQRAGDKVGFGSFLDKFLDRNVLMAEAYSNPVIMSILRERGIPLDADIKMFKENVYQHSLSTKKFATGIYNNLPKELQNKANLKDIAQGALLHDVGKVLIPGKCLLKKGELTDKERDVINLHSTLSYELLKRQGLSENVMNIIKYHHQNKNGTGYPSMSDDMGIDAQIVSLADKYSALIEKRSYKAAMSPKEALAVLKDEVENGGISNDIYDALVRYVDDSSNKTNRMFAGNFNPQSKMMNFSRMFIA